MGCGGLYFKARSSLAAQSLAAPQAGRAGLVEAGAGRRRGQTGKAWDTVQEVRNLPGGFGRRRALKFLAEGGQLSSEVWRVLWETQGAVRMLAVRTAARVPGVGGEEARGGAEQSGRGRLIPHPRDAGRWSPGGGGARSDGSLPGFRPDHPGEPVASPGCPRDRMNRAWTLCSSPQPSCAFLAHPVAKVTWAGFNS